MLVFYLADTLSKGLLMFLNYDNPSETFPGIPLKIIGWEVVSFLEGFLFGKYLFSLLGSITTDSGDPRVL